MIFVSIPRFHMENALFLERLFPRKSSTGFSEALRFGEVTRIAQDSTLAFTVDVPTGYAEVPAEILHPPRSFAQRVFTDLRRWSPMPRGGHFAALEQPEALTREITEFFRPLRSVT